MGHCWSRKVWIHILWFFENLSSFGSWKIAFWFVLGSVYMGIVQIWLCLYGSEKNWTLWYCLFDWYLWPSVKLQMKILNVLGMRMVFELAELNSCSIHTLIYKTFSEYIMVLVILLNFWITDTIVDFGYVSLYWNDIQILMFLDLPFVCLKLGTLWSGHCSAMLIFWQVFYLSCWALFTLIYA